MQSLWGCGTRGTHFVLLGPFRNRVKRIGFSTPGGGHCPQHLDSLVLSSAPLIFSLFILGLRPSMKEQALSTQGEAFRRLSLPTITEE